MILGHSLSDVDKPYFQEIVRILDNNVFWIVSWHEQGEEVHHRNFLKSLGIADDRIMIIKDIVNASKGF